MIEISDIRVFKILNPGWDGDPNSDKTIINNNPPKMIYTLHDCNFDFFNSKSFADGVSVAGQNKHDNGSSINMVFDIKFKSVSKEFISPLIPGSFSITNKTDKVVDNRLLSKDKFFIYDIYGNLATQEQIEQQRVSSSEQVTTADNGQQEPTQDENVNLVKKNEDYRRDGMINGSLLGHIDDNSGNTIELYNNENYHQQPENFQFIDLYEDMRYDQENAANHTRISHGQDGSNFGKHVHKDEVEQRESKEFNDEQMNSGDLSQSKAGSLTSNVGGGGLPKKPGELSMGEAAKDFASGIGAKLKETAMENVADYGNKLIDRFKEIRGTLINDTLRQVREPFNMPKIYPDNVYNPDFRKLSLENFARGLGSDILNDLEGGVTDILF